MNIHSEVKDLSFIKKLIWLYFILLLFEGALRKWFLPGLSQGLLIVRDPIAIWIYYTAYNKGVLSLDNIYIKALLKWTLICSLISLLAAIIKFKRYEEKIEAITRSTEKCIATMSKLKSIKEDIYFSR